jgi:hypothetical protein
MTLFDSANLLIAKIKSLFDRHLALQNDYLRQENKILRTKLGKRVSLNESERRLLVKYGLPVKDHLLETFHPVPYGCGLGHGFFHRRGLDRGRASDFLYALSHSS